jgi:restriction endonuclease S subunit
MKTKQLSTGWKEVELGEAFEIKKGKSITKNLVTAGTVPVIAGGQNPAYYHNESNREGETITVSGSGAYAGFVNYFNQPIFASDCSTLQPTKDNEVSGKYGFYFLKSNQNMIYGLQKGIAQPHVYSKDLGQIKIPLPSLSIQKKIAQILEQTEQLKQKREQADKLMHDYLKSVFNEMFWNLSKYKRFKLESLTKWITQGPNPDLKKEPKNENYGFIKTKDVYNNVIYYKNINSLSTEEFLRYKKYELENGDILLAIVGFGSIGKINIYRNPLNKRVIPTRALALIRIKREKLNPEFLRYFFISKIGQKIIENWIGGSTGQLVVKTSLLKKFEIHLPPITLQKKFASIVEKAEKIKEAQKKSKQEIEDLFNALMQKAFKGELVR